MLDLLHFALFACPFFGLFYIFYIFDLAHFAIIAFNNSPAPAIGCFADGSKTENLAGNLPLC